MSLIERTQPWRLGGSAMAFTDSISARQPWLLLTVSSTHEGMNDFSTESLQSTSLSSGYVTQPGFTNLTGGTNSQGTMADDSFAAATCISASAAEQHDPLWKTCFLIC
jgi:hypothetical protein